MVFFTLDFQSALLTGIVWGVILRKETWKRLCGEQELQQLSDFVKEKEKTIFMLNWHLSHFSCTSMNEYTEVKMRINVISVYFDTKTPTYTFKILPVFDYFVFK